MLSYQRRKWRTVFFPELNHAHKNNHQSSTLESISIFYKKYLWYQTIKRSCIHLTKDPRPFLLLNRPSLGTNDVPTNLNQAMLQLLRRSRCQGNTRLLLTKKISTNNVHRSLVILFALTLPLQQVLRTIQVTLPPKYLRLSSSNCDCYCDCYDPNTLQRIDIKVDPKDGRVLRQSITVDYAIKSTSINEQNGQYEMEFVDGYRIGFPWNGFSQSQLALARLQINGRSDDNANHGGISSSQKIARIPWSSVTESELRLNATPHPSSISNTGIQSIGLAASFHGIVFLGSNYEQHLTQALKVLYQYGILLVTSTPTDDDGASVAALSSTLSGASIKTSPDTCPLAHYRYCHDNGIAPSPILPNAINGPFRTLYGSTWSTNSEMQQEGFSTTDSAYSDEELPLHTDMTYYRDPPGLQLFTMVLPAPSAYWWWVAFCGWISSSRTNEGKTPWRIWYIVPNS